MLIVRNVFRIRPGSMKEALAQAKQGRALMAKVGFPRSRILTDVVGNFYTLILENECETLQEFEQGFSSSVAADEWQAWYKAMTPLIVEGYREILRVVEQS